MMVWKWSRQWYNKRSLLHLISGNLGHTCLIAISPPSSFTTLSPLSFATAFPFASPFPLAYACLARPCRGIYPLAAKRSTVSCPSCMSLDCHRSYAKVRIYRVNPTAIIHSNIPVQSSRVGIEIPKRVECGKQ